MGVLIRYAQSVIALNMALGQKSPLSSPSSPLVALLALTLIVERGVASSKIDFNNGGEQKRRGACTPLPWSAEAPHARARARQVVPISELVFETLSQNRSSFEDRRPTRRCHRVFRSGVGFLSKAVGHPDAPAPEAQVMQPKIARHFV